MTLDGMRGELHELERRLRRAGYQYILGAGEEPRVWYWEKFGRNYASGKRLYVVRIKGGSPKDPTGGIFKITSRRPELGFV